MSCKCQRCGSQYKVDLIVSDEIWERIKPEGKPIGGGLLCGQCIMLCIEGFGEYNVLNAKEDV